MQKTIRSYLVRQKHAPRITALKNIRTLDVNLKRIEESAAQLKKDKNMVINEINNLKGEFTAAIDRIKVSALFRKKYIARSCIHGIMLNIFTRKTKNCLNKPQRAFTQTWLKRLISKWRC